VGECVTVAIPVRNGGPFLVDVLRAVKEQRLDRPIELLVADSGSTDGSRELAQQEGAGVIDVQPERFSHGGTRQLLARQASGTHIAFLTQDAVPESDQWLANLLDGFRMAPDVALVFGPYRPRADASHMVRRELNEWFRALSPNGAPRLDRGVPLDNNANSLRRSYFTDANACIARAALERVPFREVSYAEDQLLAKDMLAAGYAKVYRPDAAVTHSHDYGTREVFRRSFDEWRALREVYGVVASGGPARSALSVQRHVRDDVQLLRLQGTGGFRLVGDALASAAYHSARAGGAMLGSRADRLPSRARALCSLEGRSTFEPVDA
jgi:glycosyltransferase involved in cell wall biosynthesis